MSRDVSTTESSFEVALAGDFGPMFLAAFAAMGVQHTSTISTFVLPARAGEGICEIVAELESRGMLILDIRPAPSLVPSPGVDHPGDSTRAVSRSAATSSRLSDAAPVEPRDHERRATWTPNATPE
jgi:hypothetical protein